MKSSSLLIPFFGFVLIVIARILPHPPNFTPVFAFALLGGFSLSGKRAFLVPLVAMGISDFFIGFHELQIPIYLFLVAMIAIARSIPYKLTNLIFLAFASNLLFFLGSNLMVFFTSGMYPQSVEGLISCYVLALPFWQNSLLGDLFYTLSLIPAVVYFQNKAKIRELSFYS
jgi:hypothetical protein